MTTPEELLEKADRCFGFAKLNREIAAGLEALAHEFMAKAVELDTERQKSGQPADGSDRSDPQAR